MQRYKAEKIRNVAIVGHGGSGKTMLVEHMLYTAGATDRVGTTDAGSSQGDIDPIEQKRHISIGAHVLPLEWHDHKINLVDCPGYPDFVGDLHGVARVVESFIIVCEAKRDLDVGFELAMEIAEEHGLATCIFVNKLERDNADFDGLMETLHDRYGRKVVSVQVPYGTQTAFSGVIDLLNMKTYKGKDRGVEIEEIPEQYKADVEYRREKMMDAAAEGDDDLAMKYLEGESLTAEEIEHGLLVGTEKGRVIPVLLGSAATGIGVATLLDRIIGELPSPAEVPKQFDDVTLTPDESAPFCGFVFKSTADPYVGKINLLRVFQGKLTVDDMVVNGRTGATERAHNITFPHGKTQEGAPEVGAGDLCAVAKMNDLQTGDTLRSAKSDLVLPSIDFPKPLYRLAIHPATKTDEDKLGPAITRLLEEDPTLRYHRESELRQEVIEGMGDIHLEVAIEKLKSRFGVTVTTDVAKVPYRETIQGSAKAQGRHKRQSGGRGQFGDCHIEVEPLPRGEGLAFESKVVGGAIPKNFIPAIEKGIREAMDKGYLAGYKIVDLKVTVTDGSYHDVDSSEMAFKIAGALALRTALEKAKPIILEPIMEMRVDVPDECVGDVVGDLNGRRGRVLGVDPLVPGKTQVTVHVPLANVQRYALDLRSVTKGRGRFSQELYSYEAMPQPEAEGMIKAFESARKEMEEASH